MSTGSSIWRWFGVAKWRRSEMASNLARRIDATSSVHISRTEVVGAIRLAIRLATRLELFFHPSGGTILSDNRGGDGDVSKWASLPSSEGWLPGYLSL